MTTKERQQEAEKVFAIYDIARKRENHAACIFYSS